MFAINLCSDDALPLRAKQESNKVVEGKGQVKVWKLNSRVPKYQIFSGDRAKISMAQARLGSTRFRRGRDVT
jgi:hypothetical protein